MTRWTKAGLVILGWPLLFVLGAALGFGVNAAEEWIKKNRATSSAG